MACGRSTAYISCTSGTASTRNTSALSTVKTAATRPRPSPTVDTTVKAASGARIQLRSAHRMSRIISRSAFLPGLLLSGLLLSAALLLSALLVGLFSVLAFAGWHVDRIAVDDQIRIDHVLANPHLIRDLLVLALWGLFVHGCRDVTV